MKNKILWGLFLCLFILDASYAQEKVEMMVEPKEMSQGTQTAFIVYIPEADSKFVESEWKKFINDRSFFEFAVKGTSRSIENAITGISNIFTQDKKDYKKNNLKVDKKDGELVVQDVLHEALTDSHVDVYARIVPSDNGTFLNSFIQYSDSVFIDANNVNEDAFQTIQHYIREFGVETYRKVVEQQISDEKKELRKQNGIMRNLENKNESLHKSIGRNESEIEEFDDEIRLSKKDKERIEDNLQVIKGSLSRLEKRSELYNLTKNNIKQAKKEIKKKNRQIKSFKKKIKQNEIDIRKTKADILINEKDQQLQYETIKKQKMKIEELENKLSNIS